MDVNNRDLYKLYIGLFAPIEQVDKFTREIERNIDIRWRYISHHYPWLTATPRFAEAFFGTNRGEYNEIYRQLLSILTSFAKKDIISEEAMNSFFGLLLIKNLFKMFLLTDDMLEKEKISLMMFEKAYIRNDLVQTLDNLKIKESSYKSYTNFLISHLLGFSMMKEDAIMFEAILEVFNGKVETRNFVEAIVANINETKWLDYFFDFMLNKSISEQDIYNIIARAIFVDNGKLENVLLIVKYMLKRAKEPPENFFNAYHKDVLFYAPFGAAFGFTEHGPSYIDSKLLFFYQVMYLAGLSYQFLANYNEKYPNISLTHWLKRSDV